MAIWRTAFQSMSAAAKLIRFGIIGIAATLIYFLSDVFFVHVAHMSAGLASFMAYLLALPVSYFGQSRFTFRSRGDSRRQQWRFAFISIIGIMISYVTSQIAVHHYHIDPAWGALVTVALVPLVSYICFDRWAFR